MLLLLPVQKIRYTKTHMRKTFIIIAVGLFIVLFPLLALPPRVEAWALLLVGSSIIIFGLYERILYKEKHKRETITTHVSAQGQPVRLRTTVEGEESFHEFLDTDTNEEDLSDKKEDDHY